MFFAAEEERGAKIWKIGMFVSREVCPPDISEVSCNG